MKGFVHCEGAAGVAGLSKTARARSCKAAAIPEGNAAFPGAAAAEGPGDAPLVAQAAAASERCPTEPGTEH